MNSINHSLVYGNETIYLAWPVQKTNFVFGDIRNLIGKPLKVIEKNKQGDCLCMTPDELLIDVWACDVQKKEATA